MSLYTAGIVVHPHGGAFVVLEKRPRKTGRMLESRYFDILEREPEYEDALVVVHAESLAGPVASMVANVAGRLEAEPMKGDTTAHLEFSALGEPLRQLFYARGCYPLGVYVGGEAETRDAKTNVVTVPIRVLQGLVTGAFDGRRLSPVEGLANSGTVLGAMSNLESLPIAGPVRDLGIAGALAVWTAHHYQTRGPWASSKPAPRDVTSEEAREHRRRAFLRAREDQARRPWWDRLIDR